MKKIASILLAACALFARPAASAADDAAAEKRSVVSAGGAITETLFRLGAGSALVGVDTSSVYPEEATKLPQVGYARTLSAEGILSLAPDLLLCGEEAGPADAIAKVEAAGVRVVRLTPGHDPEAAIARIREIGQAVSLPPEKAETLAGEIRKQIAEVASALPPEGRRPRVLFLYARGGGTLNVSGKGTAADAMIALAGGVNAVDGYEGYRPFTAEAAVGARPDVLLVTARGLEASGGAEAVWGHPGLALTPAGKNRRIAVMDDLALLGFGPRLGEALAELHGHLFPAGEQRRASR